MKKRQSIIILFVLIICLIGTLVTVFTRDNLREFGYSSREMNQTLRLTVPPVINSYTSGRVVMLFAVNTSEEPVEFQKGYRTKIFRKIGKSWELIENKLGYPEGNDVVLPKDQQFGGGIHIPVIPYVRKDEFANLRIFITGTRIGNDAQEEEVSAYIEITLHPAP